MTASHSLFIFTFFISPWILNNSNSGVTCEKAQSYFQQISTKLTHAALRRTPIRHSVWKSHVQIVPSGLVWQCYINSNNSHGHFQLFHPGQPYCFLRTRNYNRLEIMSMKESKNQIIDNTWSEGREESAFFSSSETFTLELSCRVSKETASRVLFTFVTNSLIAIASSSLIV